MKRESQSTTTRIQKGVEGFWVEWAERKKTKNEKETKAGAHQDMDKKETERSTSIQGRSLQIDRKRDRHTVRAF